MSDAESPRGTAQQAKEAERHTRSQGFDGSRTQQGLNLLEPKQTIRAPFLVGRMANAGGAKDSSGVYRQSKSRSCRESSRACRQSPSILYINIKQDLPFVIAGVYNLLFQARQAVHCLRRI